MLKFRWLMAGGMIAVAGAANAGVSATVTATNDYDFRGITQSAQDPAIQASIDYEHDAGLYVGAWGSNVDFGSGDPDVEIDLYGGFKKSLDSGFGYDVGAVYYTYHDSPSPSANYVELYTGASYQWLSGKLFYSPDYGGHSTAGHTAAWYLSADAEIPLPKDFTFQVHAGYNFGEYWDDAGEEFVDYSVGIGYTVGKFDLALKWVDGSDNESLKHTPGDVFSSDSKVVFSISTTFPWSSD